MEGLFVTAMRNYFSRKGQHRQINIKTTNDSKLQTALLKLSKISVPNRFKYKHLDKRDH